MWSFPTGLMHADAISFNLDMVDARYNINYSLDRANIPISRFFAHESRGAAAAPLLLQAVLVFKIG